MNTTKFIISLILCCCFLNNLFADPISDTIKVASKVSGKVLSRTAKANASRILTKAFQTYGDDALKMVKAGGLEALQQGAKYGDDFWKLAHNASPSAIRSLALHADDLMPVAKRIGKNFMTLESKVPGLGKQVVTRFGDDTAVYLAKNAPADDISKLLFCAKHSRNKSTNKLLIDAYQKCGNRQAFLNNLKASHIVASGLTASMIIAAYKTSDGVVELMKTNPESISFLKWLFIGIVVCFAAPVIFRWIKWNLKQQKKADYIEESKKKQQDATNEE